MKLQANLTYVELSGPRGLCMFSGTPSVPALGTFFHADVLLARYSQV